MSELFTPLNADHSQRLKFARKDVRVIDGTIGMRLLGPVAIIEIKGTRYLVTGERCGLGRCNCDASIRELEPGERVTLKRDFDDFW